MSYQQPDQDTIALCKPHHCLCFVLVPNFNQCCDVGSTLLSVSCKMAPHILMLLSMLPCLSHPNCQHANQKLL